MRGAALLVGSVLALGCVHGPDVEVSGLALRRVVIYRNGVAYFERAGHIEAHEVTFRVRKEKVGDFLATLAVIEQGGSSVRSASFPVEVVEKDDADADAGSDEAIDPRYEILLKPPPPMKKGAKKDELETVKLTLDGRKHDLVIGYVAETPVWRPSYRLVLEGRASGAPIRSPFGTIDAPAGRSAAIGSAQLQAWGIIQNLSGEDWKGVSLSLVAGAPLAFRASLEKPVIPDRPVVTDQGEVIAAVPTGETSLAESPPEPSPQPRATVDGKLEGRLAEKADDDGEGEADEAEKTGTRRPAKRPDPKTKNKETAGSASAGRASRGVRTADQPPKPAEPRESPTKREPAADKPMNPSPPRNVNALAAVAVASGTTRYDLPFKVDVPDKSATMVLLVAQRVPGEAIFLFGPVEGVPDSRSHPFRVARFTNNTVGLLERGPIAVFEDGAFLGQGMVDPLPPGATATVPFALERSMAVDVTRTDSEEGARLASIEAGEIQIERDWVTHTHYSIKNGGDLDARMLVKHPRQPGTRLFEPPRGTEDNVGTGSALVPAALPRRATQLLDVDERRVFRRRVDWLEPLADEAVRAYLADPRADAGVVAALRPAWEVRGKLRLLVDENQKLQAEKSQLEGQSEQLRRNIKAIEKNPGAAPLRKELTDRLAKASSRLDEITKRAIVLEMQISEQSIRFRDLTLPIKMLKPLPLSTTSVEAGAAKKKMEPGEIQ